MDNGKKKEIANTFHNIGLNNTNCLAAYLGSFAYDSAWNGSDLDGTILLTDKTLDTKSIQEDVNNSLQGIGVQSNVFVLNEDELKDFNFQTQAGERILFLIFGEYIIGRFDERKLAGIIIGGSETAYSPERAITRELERLKRQIAPNGEKFLEHRERLNPVLLRERES